MTVIMCINSFREKEKRREPGVRYVKTHVYTLIELGELYVYVYIVSLQEPITKF